MKKKVWSVKNKTLLRKLHNSGLLLFCCGVLCASCAISHRPIRSHPEVVALEAQPTDTVQLMRILLSGTWQLSALHGNPIRITGALPMMNISVAEQQAMGTTGCNRFIAQLLLNDSVPDAITFTPIGQTKMACQDFELERGFMEALKRVASFRVSRGDNQRPVLNLYSANHNLLITLKK